MNYKKLILFGWIICCCISGFAQKKKELENFAQDTVRVNSLLQESKQYFTDSPTLAISLATEAKDISEQIEFAVGEAYALKHLGITYYFQGQYLEALDYYTRSLEIFQKINDTVGIANMQSNIGVIYYDQGDDAKALEHYLAGLKYAELSGDKLRILTSLNNIGGVYNQKAATFDKALQYYLKALPICEALGKQNELGAISVNIGSIYSDKEEYAKAMLYFNKALSAYGTSEGGLNAYIAIGRLYLAEGRYDLALKNTNKALALSEKLNVPFSMVKSLRGLGNVYIKTGDYLKAIGYYKRAETLAKELHANNELKDLYNSMSKAYAQTNDFNSAYKYQSLYSNIKDTLYNTETDKKLGGLQFDFDMQKKQGEITLLTKDIALNEAELKSQKLVKNALAGGLVAVLLITVLIFRNYREKVKTNRILDEQKAQIETLLLNILPSEVAKELQLNGTATPRNYESVPVMFTDFKSFTTHADKISPSELVEELNSCFIAFDEIIGKYNLEKIKTIGDSYMCAGGIPTPDPDRAYHMVKASLEIQEYIVQNNLRRREENKEPWDLRIGVHVGPVVAGVVGKKKYAYDIWGSTVNIASRMESNGAAGEVNISASTYELVKDDFTCIHRGKIHAKNVGEIDMYFVAKENAPRETGGIKKSVIHDTTSSSLN